MKTAKLGPIFTWKQYVVAHCAPVGGILLPVNTFAVLGPWLAVIGLVGCVATVVVVARKRRA